MAGPISARRIFLYGTSGDSVRVLRFFLLRKLALHRNLYGRYARAQMLPLVTTGDPDFVEHDFHEIFSHLGLLNYDTTIALVVRGLGWCGMLAIVAWFVYEASKKKAVAVQGPDFSSLTRLTTPKKALGQLPLFASSEKPARDAAGHKKSPVASNRP